MRRTRRAKARHENDEKNETRNNREITVHVGRARQDDAASVLGRGAEGLRVPPRPSNPNAAARGIRERGVRSAAAARYFRSTSARHGGKEGREQRRGKGKGEDNPRRKEGGHVEPWKKTRFNSEACARSLARSPAGARTVAEKARRRRRRAR